MTRRSPAIPRHSTAGNLSVVPARLLILRPDWRTLAILARPGEILVVLPNGPSRARDIFARTAAGFRAAGLRVVTQRMEALA